MTTASLTPGRRTEGGLDVGQLDAEAADLDLMVDAAQALEAPVLEQSPHVPRSIEPAARPIEPNGLATNRSAVSSGLSR